MPRQHARTRSARLTNSALGAWLLLGSAAQHTSTSSSHQVLTGRRHGRRRSHRRRPGRRQSRPDHRSRPAKGCHEKAHVGRAWGSASGSRRQGAAAGCCASCAGCPADEAHTNEAAAALTWSNWRRGAPSGGAPLGPVTLTACRQAGMGGGGSSGDAHACCARGIHCWLHAQSQQGRACRTRRRGQRAMQAWACMQWACMQAAPRRRHGPHLLAAIIGGLHKELHRLALAQGAEALGNDGGLQQGHGGAWGGGGALGWGLPRLARRRDQAAAGWPPMRGRQRRRRTWCTNRSSPPESGVMKP